MEAPITPVPESTVPPNVPLASPVVSHHGRTVAITLGIVVIILAGAGGVAYAAYRGMIQLPFGIFAKTPPKLADIQSAAKTIEAGRVTVSMEFEVQPMQAGTPLIEKTPARPKKPGDTSTEPTASIDVSRYLSSDLKLSAELGTRFQTGDNTSADGSFKGSYSSSGLTVSLDSAFRRIKDDVYLQINSFPLPIVDVAAIAKTWVHMNTHEKAEISLFGSGRDAAMSVWGDIEKPTSTSETLSFTEQMAKSSEEVRNIQQEFLSHDVFSISSAALVTNEEGKKVWRLAMVLHPEKVRAALVAAVANRPKEGEHRILTDDMLAYVDRDVFVDWLTSVMAATKSEMDVDPETNIPLGNTFQMLYTTAGSDADKPNENQYSYTIRYRLTDINSRVAVEKPEGALELKQAIRKVLHQSDDEVAFADQQAIIGDLRSALTAYYAAHKTYPAALSDLIGVERFSRKVVNIPMDRFTGQAFLYKRSDAGDSYKLTYKMVLPKESSLGTAQFVDGMNTATVEEVSQEVTETRDFDGDGLTDSEEKKYHTNRFNKDSDGDGYTDKEEIDNGKDPLVNAKTGAKLGPFGPL